MMNPFARLAMAGPVAKTLSDIVPNNPLVGSGLAAVGMRYALRSMPAALAVIGAGAALKYFLNREKSAPVKPARTRKATSTAKQQPKPRRKAAAKPA